MRLNFASSILPETATDDLLARRSPGGGGSELRPSDLRADSDPVVDIVNALERRLEASERNFRALVENIPQVVLRLSGGRTQFVSLAVELMCGFSQADVLAADRNIWIDRIHGEDRQRVQDLFHGLTAANPMFEAEYRWQHRNGSWIWLRGRFRLTSAAESYVDGVLTDISSEKQLREETQQLQKIAAIGQCTAGIAHDFNNLLGVILASGTFLIEALPEADPRRSDAEAILEAAERAVGLTRRLLTFSRRRKFEPTIFDLNRTISAAQDMFRRVIGERIDLALSLHNDPCLVLADPSEIEQILVNLVVNARDAMREGGKLTIATTPVELHAKYVPADVALLSGNYVFLTVEDTGCGMDAETKGRIFEPFFTTKAQGQGTGLGLSTCHGIVKQVGGHIWVDSDVGRGTRFTVCLPRVESTFGVAKTGATQTAEPVATKTVLVVEDDDRLRTVVERSLRRERYRVLQARDSQEALAFAESHDGQIHLVISDVVLADRTGPDVVADVQTRANVAKALFMSGHTLEGLVQQKLLSKDANFIQKPFAPDALAKKVDEVLRG